MKRPDWKGWARAYSDVVNSAAFNTLMFVGASIGLFSAAIMAPTEAEREAMGTGAVFGVVAMCGLADSLDALRRRREKDRHDG